MYNLLSITVGNILCDYIMLWKQSKFIKKIFIKAIQIKPYYHFCWTTILLIQPRMSKVKLTIYCIWTWNTMYMFKKHYIKIDGEQFLTTDNVSKKIRILQKLMKCMGKKYRNLTINWFMIYWTTIYVKVKRTNVSLHYLNCVL